MVRLKIISLYIYKDLRLKTEDLRSCESRDHYHEDGNLVPSPRCGFRFEEAAFQLSDLKLTISVYIKSEEIEAMVKSLPNGKSGGID